MKRFHVCHDNDCSLSIRTHAQPNGLASCLSGMALRILVAAVRVGAIAEMVEISNKEPRLDVKGNIMDCHDGNILYIGGAYWNFCMAYGSCPGRDAWGQVYSCS